MLAYHFGYGEHSEVRRGKRLRPRLLLDVVENEGGILEDALDAAAAIEILHNYSLVHDDIEDHDRLRHGRETLWARYGVPQAVNAGDAMCALAFLELTRAHDSLPAERCVNLVRVLHAAHLEMCDGQSLDLSFEAEPLVLVRGYERMIAGKTSALFGAACEMGAICAGTDSAARKRYRAVGRAFGMAFQIHDDVLGIWGSTEATGKTAANDLVRRKWTFPVAWALSATEASPAQRFKVANAYVSGSSLDAKQVASVIEALDEMGAREAAHREIAKHLAVIDAQAQGGLRDLLLSTMQLSVP
ncbi:MAG: polyprenyl synthetase family protein [Candidatus Eremiobacteraeota bacterium]|nr:polyprenyl synthetase family protein [Candidatus Eremiobacteraeota bacterium]